ncbi:MAG: L,D-transpeptidase [Myxococcales bacterium]|nr:L,D-transpeptidase [Myxococcales bacterium]MDH3485282.1 L,D-transpeptidase [Myxococcales bacterium]
MSRLLENPWTVIFLVIVTACIGGGTVAFGEQETGIEERQPRGGHTDHGASSSAANKGRQRVLQAPTNDWDTPSPPKNNPGRSELFGKAFHYDAFIYDKAGDKPGVAGIVRRGSILRVGGIVNGSGCNDGTWYKAEPFGYVCTSLGFHVSDKPSSDSYGVPPAKVEARLPYQYARVTTKRAPRYYRMPTVQEEKQARRAMEKKGPTPEVVSSLMEGDYFLALAETETREADGAVFYRTVRNRYVREGDLELRNPEVVRGERLGKDGWELPIAFVYGEDRPLLERRKGTLANIGIAERHVRFVIKEEFHEGDRAYVAGSEGIVLREEVRIVRDVKRPSGIPANTKWIHVDLSEQTLVAYEGDRPVYATVVSSGKEGYEPPTGTFQVQEKHISTTMNATDPIDGFYEVEEVPWTMYYHEGYALHGAYWHTDFGKVRSHGCTNIAPVDARWLYYWSDPDVPPAWHGVRFRPETTWVYFTS